MRLATLGLSAIVASRVLVAQSSAADTSARPAARFNIAFGGTLSSNVAGGIARGSVVQSALLAEADFDLRRLAGWKGGRAFASVLGATGQSPDQLVGDLQGVLWTEAPAGLRLEEAWIEQRILRNRASILVGRYDVNSEFYRLQSAAIFLNGSFGMGAELGLSGVRGPSTYPFTAVGARVNYTPAPNTMIRAALLDGVPVDRPGGGIHLFAPGNGLFAIAEVSLLARADTAVTMARSRLEISRGTSPPYAAKIAAGVWGYTTNPPDVAIKLRNGSREIYGSSRGAYVIADKTLSTSNDDTTQVAIFAQLGVGEPRVSIVDAYTGAGVLLTGALPRRRADQIGLGIASARFGSRYRRAREATGTATSPAETAVEAAYLAYVASWIGLRGDVQYVARPGGRRGLRGALVPGLQLAILRTF